MDADLEAASAKAKNTRKAEQARQRILDRWLEIETKFQDPATPKKSDDLKTPEAPNVTSEQDGPVTL